MSYRRNEGHSATKASDRGVLLRLTTTVGMAYLPTGFAFGVLATQAGLSPAVVIAMSIFIFAGALQFAAVPLLSVATGLGAFAMTTLLINLRHVLYAIPLIEHLPARRWQRAYIVAALTDENYSVLTTLPTDKRQQFAMAVTLIHHVYWIAGTVLGVLLGQKVADWIPNLDFALPSLFTILAIEQYLSQRRLTPALIGVLAYFAATRMATNYLLITALGFGLATLLARALVRGNAVEAS
ncbi:MAG: branched-chain amino acid permease [Ralstonia sp.]|jgi:4-azaleucine resistance transporter AzlC|uniref:Inner membrane protein YgaZ n=2 Tax=Burkholderiaceae TaxID=119060 RepID=A0ABM9IIW7_RALPI|nr:branched-chain amino acid permease [Ralstonia sp.]POH86532.1 branched-chain amino acid permease [Ralstonia pickettii]MBA4200027.1 branched-chain amino acid permease [Ralstonia sp.]MBA4229083.1 branched-chain amino acid permease [Ralstonia sp.]MBA4236579.1 branched-chain amino acid permease [Ralstonia sp.]